MVHNVRIEMTKIWGVLANTWDTTDRLGHSGIKYLNKELWQPTQKFATLIQFLSIVYLSVSLYIPMIEGKCTKLF